MSVIRGRRGLKGPLLTVLLAVVVIAAVIGLIMLSDLGLKIGSAVAAIPIVSSFASKLNGQLVEDQGLRVAPRQSDSIVPPLPPVLPSTDASSTVPSTLRC